MEDNSAIFARNIILNIIFFLTLLIVILDFVQLYDSINSLKKYIESDKFNEMYFEECIKYQSFSEIIFGFFGSIAGISACVVGFSLIVNFEYFVEKCLKTFCYFNYVFFGPYLLGCTFLGLHHFNKISYVCSDKNDLSKKNLNLLIVFCLFLAFFISSFVISLYTSVHIVSYFIESIRFSDGGSYILGKIFWRYVIERSQNLNFNNNNNIDINNNNNGNNGIMFLDDFDNTLQLFGQNGFII